ncbi:MAG: lysoplasmalogenase family protein [Flavobacterium sp.]
MKRLSKSISLRLIGLYFFVSLFHFVFIATDNYSGTFVTRFLTPILLLGIYFSGSSKYNYWFIAGIIATFFSNFFLNFDGNLYGILAILFFIIYRIISIWIVINFSKRIRLFSVMLGTIPFLTLLTYIIILTYDSLGFNFYPAILNAILVSIMSGIALSKFVFEDDVKNNPLILSAILFTILVVLYMLEHFYMNLKIFAVVRSVIYVAGHYFFLRYVMLSEPSKGNDS